MSLGKLEKVNLRSVWEHEAQDFTPWLAREDNLAELGRTIGMELEFVAQEQSVGSYSADIVCKDTLSQSFVLIENQLEKTNHTHLGQILTYAAGVNAKAVVWVASKFTDEHRAAMDWLNEITEEDFGFFALEIELWRIGNSSPAPKFNVVSRPNDWRKGMADTPSHVGVLSDTKRRYQVYWAGLRNFLSERSGTMLRSQKPLPQHWTNLAIGRSGFSMAATASIEKQRIGAEVYMQPRDIDPKEAFAILSREREEIEKELSFSLEWQELPDAKGSRVVIFKHDIDVADEASWPSQFEWLAHKLEKLHDVLGPRIKKL